MFTIAVFDLVTKGCRKRKVSCLNTKKTKRNMEMTLENFNNPDLVANRLEALKTLTKLLMYEVESLAEVSPSTKLSEQNEAINLNDQVQRFEIKLISNAMLSAKGNQRRAAKMLGMKTTTLHAKLKRYEIDSVGLISHFSPNTSQESF